MSAWVVEREHIDVIIRYALSEPSNRIHWMRSTEPVEWRALEYEDATDVGRMLAEENVNVRRASVSSACGGRGRSKKDQEMNDDHSKHVDRWSNDDQRHGGEASYRLTEPFPPETWLDWCDGDIEQLAVDAIEELHRRGKLNAYMERWFAL